MEASIRSKVRSAACLVCGAAIPLDTRLLIGEVVECTSCGTSQEVAGIDPPILELLAKVEVEEEDFDDNDA